MDDTSNGNKCSDCMGSGTIYLKVVSLDNNDEIHFKAKKTIRMGIVMKKYAERVGVPMTLLRFMFNGNLITEDDTLTQLKMKDNDVVQVFQKLTRLTI